MEELLIRGATVVDGTGVEPFEADVTVSGGVITQVGSNLGKAKRTVEERAAPRTRHHRLAYTLRRAGYLGSYALALSVSGRHHHRDGQLRLWYRA